MRSRRDSRPQSAQVRQQHTKERQAFYQGKAGFLASKTVLTAAHQGKAGFLASKTVLEKAAHLSHKVLRVQCTAIGEQKNSVLQVTRSRSSGLPEWKWSRLSDEGCGRQGWEDVQKRCSMLRLVAWLSRVVLLYTSCGCRNLLRAAEPLWSLQHIAQQRCRLTSRRGNPRRFKYIWQAINQTTPSWATAPAHPPPHHRRRRQTSRRRSQHRPDQQPRPSRSSLRPLPAAHSFSEGWRVDSVRARKESLDRYEIVTLGHDECSGHQIESRYCAGAAR